jgi:hypothetical protein
MRHFGIIALLGLGALGASMQPALSQQPIKIGVMFPLTGPLASQGVPERDAIKRAFDEAQVIDRPSLATMQAAITF